MAEDRCRSSAGFDHAEIVDLCQGSLVEDLSPGEMVVIGIILFMLLCCLLTIVYYNYRVTLGFLTEVVLQDKRAAVRGAGVLSGVSVPKGVFELTGRGGGQQRAGQSYRQVQRPAQARVLFAGGIVRGR